MLFVNVSSVPEPRYPAQPPEVDNGSRDAGRQRSNPMVPNGRFPAIASVLGLAYSVDIRPDRCSTGRTRKPWNRHAPESGNSGINMKRPALQPRMVHAAAEMVCVSMNEMNRSAWAYLLAQAADIIIALKHRGVFAAANTVNGVKRIVGERLADAESLRFLPTLKGRSHVRDLASHEVSHSLDLFCVGPVTFLTVRQDLAADRLFE